MASKLLMSITVGILLAVVESGWVVVFVLGG
jgi:hypothetical protein